jgi:hypothetical protein
MLNVLRNLDIRTTKPLPFVREIFIPNPFHTMPFSGVPSDPDPVPLLPVPQRARLHARVHGPERVDGPGGDPIPPGGPAPQPTQQPCQLTHQHGG